MYRIPRISLPVGVSHLPARISSHLPGTVSRPPKRVSRPAPSGSGSGSVRTISRSTVYQNESPFFNPNKTDIPPDLGSHIKAYFETKPLFKGLKLTPHELVIKTTEIQQLLSNKTYDAMDSFEEIIDCNENHVPIVGSLIQYKDPENGTKMAVVVREALSKFNDSYNKVLCLTTDNTIESIYTQDVHIHLHGVLDNNWINSLQILAHRHDPNYYSRQILVDMVKQINNEALKMSDTIKLDILYAQKCQETSLVSVSLIEMMEFVTELAENEGIFMNQDYLQQSIVILAIYNNLNQAPYQWLVSTNYPSLNGTNIVDHDCSNNLIQRADIFCLPSELMSSIYTFTTTIGDKKGLVNLNRFIDNLVQQQTSSHKRNSLDLNMFFSFWDGAKYKYFLDTLKFLIIYPNADIMTSLTKVNYFSHLDVVKPKHIFEFLRAMGIYDQLTDIHLSNDSIYGPKSVKKISVTPEQEFNAKMDSRQVVHDISKRDLFQHLRRTSSLNTSDVIYGLSIGGMNVGVSLQKSNTRNYIVNVHIPDMVTAIPPNSNTFKHWVETSPNQTKSELWNNSIDVFDSTIKSSLGVSGTETKEDPESLEYKNVGQVVQQFKKPKPQDRSRNITCMTISFKYNTHDSNPFAKVSDKVLVSFNDTSRCRFKPLNSHELNTAIAGKKTTLPFSLFRSPGRSDTQNSSQLIEEDYQNIGFINGVLKSHFSVRNINGSMNINLRENKDELTKANFFITELDNFVSNLTANYCKEHEIPIISQLQNILSMPESYDPSIDEVLVNHDNLLLPHFHSTSFFQTLISRDAGGYVSLAAYIIGKNYLTRPEITGDQTKHVPKGMTNGYVSILRPGDSLEAFLNQFQLLSHMQWLFAAERLWKLYDEKEKETNIEYALAKRFSYLKGLGYNLNGPLPQKIIEKHLVSLKESHRMNSYISKNQIRYCKLKQLEQVLSNEMTFEGVVTSTGHLTPLGLLCKCYVKELDLEVDMVLDSLVSIGTVVQSEVVYLSAVDHVCVVRERIPY